MARMTNKSKLELALSVLNNPLLKCVPDEITGKRYALCLMATENKDERVIDRHISPYMEPNQLCAFICGYKQALMDNCFD